MFLARSRYISPSLSLAGRESTELVRSSMFAPFRAYCDCTIVPSLYDASLGSAESRGGESWTSWCHS